MEDGPEISSVALEYVTSLREGAVPWLRECEALARKLGDEFSAGLWRALADAAERVATSPPRGDRG
jgi:hypothetical protein